MGVLAGFTMVSPNVQQAYEWSRGPNKVAKAKIDEVSNRFLEQSLSMSPITSLLSNNESQLRMAHIEAKRCGLAQIVRKVMAWIGYVPRYQCDTEFQTDIAEREEK